MIRVVFPLFSRSAFRYFFFVFVVLFVFQVILNCFSWYFGLSVHLRYWSGFLHGAGLFISFYEGFMKKEGVVAE